MNVMRVLGLGSLCVAALMSVGCAAALIGGGAAVGMGAAAYIRGELEAHEDAALDQVYEASLRAMDDLEFRVTEYEKDAVDARIEAKGAGDKKIQVALDRKADETTRIRIRVGTFGDEEVSRLILDKIRANL